MRKIVGLLVFMLFIGVVARAQGKISGTVRDQNGDPVPFATVNVKGTKVSVAADASANFTIPAKSGDVLVITAVGLQNQEVTVGNSLTVTVVLTRTTGNINDVVVTTALGIQRQSKELGYSTAKVTARDLTQAKVTNVGTGLAAKVSGLQVNLINNGVKPDIRITLRGNRSILGNNQALLVVDDIQLPISYLASLNPDDVDNVTVLKGASASALYGSSASNGVIIVTTKKGTKGKPQVTFSSTESIENVSYLPKFQNEFGQNGGETSANPGTVHIGDNPFIWYVPYENQNYGPRFNGQMVPLGPPIRIYNPDGSYVIKQDSIPYSAKPGAKSNFFDKGLTSQNEISYSSGDDKGTFYLSFQDVLAKGVNPGDKSRRDAIRINGSRQSGMFSATYNFGYTINHANTTPGAGVPFTWGNTGFTGGFAGGGSYFQNRPLYWEIVNQPADVDLSEYRNWQTDPFASPDGYFNAYYGNPWWQIDQTRLDEKSNDLLGEVALNFKPTDWLGFQFRSSIARDDYSNKYTQAGYTFQPWAIADTLGASNIPSSVKKLAPSEGDGVSYNQRLTYDFLASAKKTYGDISVRLIAGAQSIDARTRIMSLSASALVIPDFYNISNRLGTPAVNELLQHTRLLGVYGDLTLGYKDYLFLHGSLRNDWNSLLSKANRSYPYPAGDVSFVFTNAIPSLKNNSVLSYGKLRGALSRTEQVSIGAYALENTFDLGPGFPFSSGSGYTVNNTFANPDIKPEQSTDEEIGLELGFLKQRLSFSAAVYNTNTKNQTIPIQISGATGYTSAYVNSGEMNNKGIELDLTYAVIQSKNVRWEVGANYAYNKNTVKSLGFGLNEVDLPNALAYNLLPINIAAVIDQPYSQVKTTDWLRDDQGRIIVDKNTGNPTADPTQHTFGTTVPPTKIGITTSVSYKNFTLSAVADGRFGAVIFNGIGNALDFTGVSWYSAQTGRQPFVIPNTVYDGGDGKYVPNTNITASGTGGGPLAGQGAQVFWAGKWNSVGNTYVNSADFWKLREVSLSYDFPQSMINGLKVVHALSIGLVGRNLIMIKAKDNPWTDPEFANTNGNAVGNTDLNQLPPTRFYGINVSVTF
jgi:TonB-linked SusC/RagA family outer membrane protein